MCKNIYLYFCMHFQLISEASWNFGDWISSLAALVMKAIPQEPFPDISGSENARQWTNMQILWYIQPGVNNIPQHETTKAWENYGSQEKGISINN